MKSGSKGKSAFHLGFRYFSASVIQGVLAFVALPFATTILGPSEYGVYALVTSFSLLVSAFADLGQQILFAGHYGAADDAQRKSLFSSAIISSFILACVLALLFVLLWNQLAAYTGAESAISETILWLAAASIPLRVAHTTGNHFFNVSGRADLAAILITGQAVANFVVLMFSLFILDLQLLSLFLGNISGLLVAALGTIILLRKSLTVAIGKFWLMELFKIAPATLAASVAENARAAIENLVLTRFLGVNIVGIWTHARLYHALLMQGTNPIAYVMWPKALEEARTGNEFELVGRVWNAVYVWLVVAGIFFAFFGGEIIMLLTNGKFVDAAIWVPLLIAYLLLQHAGKAATATVYGLKKGVWTAHFRIITLIPSIVAIWFLVPTFGIGGVVTIMFAEMFVFRLLMGHRARRLRRIPFQDRWILIGILLILGIHLLIFVASPTLAVRGLLFVVAIVGVMILGRRELRDTISQLRRLFKSDEDSAVARLGG